MYTSCEFFVYIWFGANAYWNVYIFPWCHLKNTKIISSFPLIYKSSNWNLQKRERQRQRQRQTETERQRQTDRERQRAVHYQSVNYLQHSNVLWERQCGYKRKAGDKGLITGVCLSTFLRHSTLLVGYSRLITKVQFYGIKVQALQWFTDSLFAPNQLVKFNNETSHEFTLICGAPQSSILEPVLFLIF